MDLATLAMIAALAVLGYFMLIRPQQKRAKEQAALMKSLEPGTRVMMSGGVYGTLRHVGEKQVVVEVSPGVEMTFVKQAIVPPAEGRRGRVRVRRRGPGRLRTGHGRGPRRVGPASGRRDRGRR